MRRLTLASLLVLLAGAMALGGPKYDPAKDDAWVAPRKNWWAFQKVERPPVPPGRNLSPVDAFLLEALRDKGLTPAPPLGKRALVRRLYLDLTGLPPAPEEVERFVSDSSAGAYEALVDRLLASPRYGERWATKWLDVVRYADTNGYELDSERPQAWRYRDYVIRAFQNDKPYDRFLQEQIAGDELWPGDRDALIATGFHRAGPQHLVGGNQDEEMNRQEVLVEMTTGVGATFLGLTIHCARCHNHKFDPIPQADYYRLQAVLAGTEGKEVPLAGDAEKTAYEVAVKAYEARLKPIKDAIAEIEKPYRDRLRDAKKAKLDPVFLAVLDVPKDQQNDEQKRLFKEASAQIKVSWDDVVNVLAPADRDRRAALRRQMHRLEYEKPEPPPAAFAVANMEAAPATHILKIGNHKMKLDEVGPGLLRVLDAPAVADSVQGRRSALARWLAAPDHPLTARVMVNRIWQMRMGRGLVPTLNDFGVLGARPTNRKLLDWLAAEFVANGWSVKKLDRAILLSNAYRMAPAYDEASANVDPGNDLYWRAHRRRLEAEFLRDSVLAVSGALNPALFGKPVKVPLEPEVYDLIFTEGEPDNLWPVNLDEADHNRRTIYLLNKRTVRLPFLANFDQPDAMTSCPARATSTHALQALSLMNSDLMQRQSERFAKRVEADCKGAAGGREGNCFVSRAYALALGRPPEPAELTMANQFLGANNPPADFCLALLNRNEFAYLP
ncbi:MAG: DUF1549 and DUF1553 domain-containing protein [Bryobacteraceae bacterium]